MNSSLEHMTLLNFLDYITEKKNEIGIEVNGAIICSGSKSVMKKFISKLGKETYTQLTPDLDDKEEFTTPLELTRLEIYNYFEFITGNFNPVKVKMTLEELEVYRCMDLDERVIEESQKIYAIEGWDVPKMTFFHPFTKQDTEVQDTMAMKARTHPYVFSNINYAIKLLKESLNENKIIDNEKKSETPIILDNKEESHTDINPYPEIFKNYKSFMLFDYLLIKFGRKEINHADCSFIFRQMYEDGKIYKNIRENDFREFLNHNYEITKDKLKTLDNCDKGKKMDIYSTAIELIYR